MWSFGRNKGSLVWKDDRHGEKDRQGSELGSKQIRKFKIFGTKDKDKNGSFGQKHDRLESCSKNFEVKNWTEYLITQRSSQNLEGYMNSSKIKPLLNLENKKGQQGNHQFRTNRYFDQNQHETNLDLNKFSVFNAKTQTVAFVSSHHVDTKISTYEDFTNSTSILSETLCEEDIVMIETTLKRLDSGQQNDKQFNINSQQKVYLTFSLVLLLLTVLLCLFITKA